MNISFIGGGNMANAILCGLKNNGFSMQNVIVIEANAEKRTELNQKFNVNVTEDIQHATRCDIVILAVKPQQLKTVCHALSAHLSQQLIISIAAGVRATTISNWLKQHPLIIRVMPNTPAQIQAGVSAMYALDAVTKVEKDRATTILNAVGRTLWLNDENEMDAVTAISGSGPAYVFYMIEALQEAAEKLGLSTENARLLALETFAGASLLAQKSHDSVQVLRAQVTSKGGTTEQGILVLESANIKEIMYQTAKAAAEKSVILGNALDT